jgi:DNA-binding SARP family transcriptional activator
MADDIITLSLFGGAVVRPVNRPPQPIRSRKSGSVLARLLLARDAMFSRQHMLDAFWPDSEPEQQRAAFNTEIWRLRQTLTLAFGAKHVLRTDGDFLMLDAAVHSSSDIVQFRNLRKTLADACLSLAERRAAGVSVDALYQGPLLPADHDDWVHGMREVLRGEFLDALEVCIALAEQDNDWLAVRALALRLVSEDPYLEQAYRALMRAHLALGNRSAALASYDFLKSLLQSELGVQPMRETRQLADSLRLAPEVQPIKTLAVISQNDLAHIPASLSRIARELEGLSQSFR